MAIKQHYYKPTRDIRQPIDWRAGLTQLAFGLAVALVAARCMLLETIRDPFEISPGSTPIPRGAGADTSIILNLLCCLPAILVLVRRCLDKTYTLRWSWSLFFLLPLVGWMGASIHWADDKFAAVISSANFVAAMALLWAMVQIVRSWMRLRMVAAVAFGLLLVFLVRGFTYKFIDMPILLEQQSKILQQSGFDPHSFHGTQLAQKISELMGFNSSANSFAGLIVLFMIVGLGVAIQRIKDKDDPAWTVALALSAPLAIWLLIYAQTKATLVMPIFVLAVFAFLWKFHGRVARQSKRAYWIGVAATVLLILAVVGHGLFHHSLPTSSLNFRWRYWAASWRMFLRHPVRGVGWDNYGPHYVRDRLPAASEEIKDPHDFLVRFFVELGAIGGVLAVAWFTRLWWELTRPFSPPPQVSPISKTAKVGPVLFLVWVALGAVIINAFANIDFAQDPGYVFSQLLNLLLYLCALVLGTLVVALRSLEKPQVDERAAPWILYGILTALGVFLIHNLIEFSLFEAGPLCLFGVLVGACLGIRLDNPPVRKPGVPIPIYGILAIACILWLAAIDWIAIPVWRAESAAHAGDEKLRAGDLLGASAQYQYAYTLVPWNADYAFRAARSIHLGVGPPVPMADAKADTKMIDRVAKFRNEILSWYDVAISENPSMLPAYHMRAIFELQAMQPKAMVDDFDKVLELNPNEVSLRLEYARDLDALDMPAAALEQFELALKFNDQLDPDEPKRLTPDELSKTKDKIAQLRAQIQLQSPIR
jgi:O-antigen ligase